MGNYETVCEKGMYAKFGLDRFMNKGMKERYYFAVWIGMMVWKRDELDLCNTDCDLSEDYDAEDYYKNDVYGK